MARRVAQPVGHHRLKSLEVVGGFLDGIRFDFCDGLNCLIGGRGTGKTTVIEFVRYALAALPSGEDHRLMLRDIENLVRNNLGGGRIQLTIETKEGLSYVVNRTLGEDPEVSTMDGKTTGISLGQGAFFSADVYSQNQIEGIANNPRFQLVLIDSFIEPQVAEIEAKLQALDRKLSDNAAEVLRVERDVAELQEGLGELPTVEEKLKGLAQAQGDDADKINRQHELKALRDRQKRAIQSLAGKFQEFRESLEACSGVLGREVGEHLPAEVVSGPNEAMLSKVRQVGDESARRVDSLLGKAAEDVGGTLERFEELGANLLEAHAEQEKEFRAVIEAHQVTQVHVAERSRLERHRNELIEKKRLLEAKKTQARGLAEARVKMMREVSELRDSRFALRKKVADDLTARLGPTIRVSVEQFGNPQLYADQLMEALRNSGVQVTRVAEKVVKGMIPADFALAVRQMDKDALMERGGLNSDQAQKVVAKLAGTQDIFRMETAEILDLPRIELLDGSDYKDSATLSTGQKCTTILPILLLESESPLLIDQPEDNLDNRFIYETVVQNVRNVKRARQLIFVTHNPNIPVLGEAEKVFVLDSSGRRGTVEHSGTVDECKAEVETLLEGGKEAFEMRMRKYGH
jgi:ABC-type uncharacterized transport system ATPase subunit